MEPIITLGRYRSPIYPDVAIDVERIEDDYLCFYWLDVATNRRVTSSLRQSVQGFINTKIKSLQFFTTGSKDVTSL